MNRNLVETLFEEREILGTPFVRINKSEAYTKDLKGRKKLRNDCVYRESDLGVLEYFKIDSQEFDKRRPDIEFWMNVNNMKNIRTAKNCAVFMLCLALILTILALTYFVISVI